jgi:hypothetical protein
MQKIKNIFKRKEPTEKMDTTTSEPSAPRTVNQFEAEAKTKPSFLTLLSTDKVCHLIYIVNTNVFSPFTVLERPFMREE